MAYKYQKSELYFLVACILISVVLVLAVFQSFIGAFVFSSIFAASLLPLHKKIVKKISLPPKLSAAILVAILGVLILYPLTFIVTNSYEEISSIISSLQTNNPILLPKDQTNETLPVKVHNLFLKITSYDIPQKVFDDKWHQYTQKVADEVLTYLNYVISNTTSFLFNFIIFILTTFIILTKGESLKKTFFKLSLLPEIDEEYILRKFEHLNRVLLLGNTIGGTIQSLVGFILMSFMGLDKIFFWSLLIFACSFIPVLGSAVVFVPMSVYLWFMGKKALAIVLLGIMSVAYLLVENWFKPKFIGGRIQMHSLIILFSMLGGVKFFGIAGIFYGPLITTLFLSLMELYNKQANVE